MSVIPFISCDGGGFHSLGLRADGSIVAWGRNDYGQCDVPAPNVDWVAIAAGGNHSLGLKANGTVMLWGDNAFGQCDVPSPNADFTAIAGCANHCMGLKANGSVIVWGDSDGQKYSVPLPNENFIAVADGLLHSLGLKSDGSIVAWGYNVFGQCNVPAPNTDFVAMAGGGLHSLGLKSNGTIVAWGLSIFGQSAIPSPNADFIAVAEGNLGCLGLKTDGTIVAWGRNDHGQCDVALPNEDFVAVAAGLYHSLGLKADGPVVAWGDTDDGRCDVPVTEDWVCPQDESPLFIHGLLRLGGGGVLACAGSRPVFDDAALMLRGPAVPVSGYCGCLIHGQDLPAGPSCPVLDPTASIQIGDDLIAIYQSRIDALINQLGKNVYLEFDPVRTPCDNCEYDVIRGRSRGVYLPGGPKPFTRGHICPQCKGAGFLEVPTQVCVKCLLKWNPATDTRFGISVDDARGLVRLKTHLTHAPQIMRAKTAVVHQDVAGIMTLRVKKVRGPYPTGLREDRYCVSFWELIDG